MTALSLRSAVQTSKLLTTNHINITFPISLQALINRINQETPISLRKILDLLSTPVLIFSKNSPRNNLKGFDFPEDMPTVNWPAVSSHCDHLEHEKIKLSWVFAHYFTWRAYQVIEFIANSEKSVRPRLWEDGYNPAYGSDFLGFTNYTPRGWFGSYNEGRFEKIRAAIKKVWQERFLGETSNEALKTIQIKCRSDDSGQGAHPCFVFDVAANHIKLGTINCCVKWFERGKMTRARLLVHEIFHWLKIPTSVWWVSDSHDYYVTRPGGRWKYMVVDKLYRDKAAYIANHAGPNNKNYERTFRNNDNYAFFIYKIGRKIYDGDEQQLAITQFPSTSFNWKS